MSFISSTARDVYDHSRAAIPAASTERGNGPMAQRVNLDAMIRREDFGVVGEEYTLAGC